MVPTSTLGKIIGGFCAISGILLIAMPVGLLSNNFTEFHKKELSRSKIIEKYNAKLIQQCQGLKKQNRSCVKPID